MEYTKDIILNVQYGEKVGKFGKSVKKFGRKIAKIYKENKFITLTLSLTSILIVVDLCMVSKFINILITL